MPKLAPMLHALAFALLCAGPLPALAVNVDVKVSETGTSATEAREKALAAGQQKAFSTFAKQRSPAKAQELIDRTPPEQIGKLVQGFEVLNETMTGTSYKGTLRYDFNDVELGKLLGQEPFSPPAMPADDPLPEEQGAQEVSSTATLLIPLFKSEAGSLLWESPNPWRNAINRAALEQGRGAMLVPYGDPKDSLLLNSGNAASADHTLVKPLLKRYGAAQALLVTATPVETASPPYIEITLRKLEAKAGKPETIRVEGSEKQTLEQALDVSADELIKELTNTNPLGDYAPQELTAQAIDVRFAMRSPREWADLRQRLATISGIESMRVRNADWQSMMVEIMYKGDSETLRREMAAARVSSRPGAGNILDLGLQ